MFSQTYYGSVGLSFIILVTFFLLLLIIPSWRQPVNESKRRSFYFTAFVLFVLFFSGSTLLYDRDHSRLVDIVAAPAHPLNSQNPVLVAQADFLVSKTHACLKKPHNFGALLGFGLKADSPENIRRYKKVAADCLGQTLDAIAVLNGPRATNLAGLAIQMGMEIPARWSGATYDEKALLTASN